MIRLLFPLLFLFWIVSEVINHLVGKGGRIATDSQAKDRGSYWLLMLVAFFSLSLAFSSRILQLATFPEWTQIAGLVLMAAGNVLRQWAVITLGRHFSVIIAIESDHQLVQTGPYRWVRHPAYTGGLLAALGIQLVIGNWLTLFVSAAALIPAFIYRIKVEEIALLTRFGDTYRAYRRQTWALLPGW